MTYNVTWNGKVGNVLPGRQVALVAQGAQVTAVPAKPGQYLLYIIGLKGEKNIRCALTPPPPPVSEILVLADKLTKKIKNLTFLKYISEWSGESGLHICF